MPSIFKADAGLDRTTTTAHTLCVLTFHLLQNPEILKKLQLELESVIPEPDSQPRWSELEQLPFLVRSSPRLRSLHEVSLGGHTISYLFRLLVFRNL